MSISPVRDLRHVFGAVRSQGSRPTCCALACTDLHAACRPPWSMLSGEYAFYHGARRQGTGPNSGVHLHHMLDAIDQDGQPVESAWPYLAVVPSDLALWVPPPDVGQVFQAKGVRSPGGVVAVRTAIDQNRPVIIVMSLSDAFYFVNGEGVIDATEPVDPTRVHALIGVGHGVQGSDAFTLVRNSWGEGWGFSGYAWLSDSYLAPRILEIATMSKVD